jgi:hypothetical protein
MGDVFIADRCGNAAEIRESQVAIDAVFRLVEDPPGPATTA